MVVLKQGGYLTLDGTSLEDGTAPAHDPAWRAEFLAELVEVFVLILRSDKQGSLVLLLKPFYIIMRFRELKRGIAVQMEYLLRAECTHDKVGDNRRILAAGEAHEHLGRAVALCLLPDIICGIADKEVIALPVRRYELVYIVIKYLIGIFFPELFKLAAYRIDVNAFVVRLRKRYPRPVNDIAVSGSVPY